MTDRRFLTKEIINNALKSMEAWEELIGRTLDQEIVSLEIVNEVLEEAKPRRKAVMKIDWEKRFINAIRHYHEVRNRPPTIIASNIKTGMLILQWFKLKYKDAVDYKSNTVLGLEFYREERLPDDRIVVGIVDDIEEMIDKRLKELNNVPEEDDDYRKLFKDMG